MKREKVLLYWNNVCILSRGERELLQAATEKLKGRAIDLEVRHFGLGAEMHMSTYLAAPSARMPDMIVSTDLEVFENNVIFSRIKEHLLPLLSRFPVKDYPAVRRGDCLLPYIIIPLVFHSLDKELPSSLEEAIRLAPNLAFGGIDNSAGKTVFKTVWSKFGKEGIETFTRNSTITDMPVQSFDRVRKRQSDFAIIPSVFALSAKDGRTEIPGDGAIALPSYIAALDSIDTEVASVVIEELNNEDFLSFFRKAGHLVTAKANSPDEGWFENSGNLFQAPDKEWLEALDITEFEKFYNETIKAVSRRV
jgi:hypothetical protein